MGYFIKLSYQKCMSIISKEQWCLEAPSTTV